MGFNGLENSIYSINNDGTNPYAVKFTANKTSSLNNKTASKPLSPDSFVNNSKKDKSNDNKFSFSEFGKNILKGAGNFFVNIAKGIVEHPLMALGTAGLLALVASSPLGFMILAGGSLTGCIFSLCLTALKTGMLIGQKKWDSVEKQGQEFGKLIPEFILSGFMASKATQSFEKAVTGIKSVSKNFSLSESFANFSRQIKKASKFDIVAFHWIKNAVLTPFRAIKQGNWNLYSIFKKANRADYSKMLKGLEKNPLFSSEEIKFLQRNNKLFTKPRVSDWQNSSSAIINHNGNN